MFYAVKLTTRTLFLRLDASGANPVPVISSLQVICLLGRFIIHYSITHSGSMSSWGVACAATTFFQRIRSSAMVIASGIPTSFETTDSQQFRGLLGGLFHCDGVGAARACLVSLARSNLATWSKRPKRLLIIEVRGNWFVLRRTSSFVTKSFHLMPQVLLRHHLSRASISFSSVAVRDHVSLPYKKIDKMHALYSLSFKSKGSHVDHTFLSSSHISCLEIGHCSMHYVFMRLLESSCSGCITLQRSKISCFLVWLNCKNINTLVTRVY